MEVNLPSLRVPQYEARRKARLNRRVVSEAVFLQCLSRAVEAIAVKSKIEVSVPPRLLADEGVDAPTPIHEDEDAFSIERVQHVDYIFCGHRESERIMLSPAPNKTVLERESSSVRM
jgi:hypothetical protein